METEELELYVKPLMEIIPMTKSAAVVTSDCEGDCPGECNAVCGGYCEDDECSGCDGGCPDIDTCGPSDECPDDCNPDCDAIEE